jgi:colicin import membrane protein
MSDQQMQGVMGLASVTDLAKMQIAHKLSQNNQIRQAAQQAQAQARAGQQPQTSIAEEAMMQMGVGGLDVPEDTFNAAGGGIVAFARGGDAGGARERFGMGYSAEEDAAYKRKAQAEGGDAGGVRERFGGYSAEEDAAYKRKAQAEAKAKAEAKAAAEERVRVAARNVTKPSASPTSAAPTASDYAGLSSLVGKYANLGDEPMKAAEEATRTAGNAEIKANEDFVAQMRADQKAMGERGVEEMKSIKASQKDMKGAEDKNLNMALIEAGLAIMSGTSENAFENIGKGASVGLKGYKEGVDKIQLKKDKLQESLNRLNDARFSDKKDKLKKSGG